MRYLIIGAHPDDAEFHAGGLATLARRRGDAVRMLSVTNGNAGHHEMKGPPLAKRRRAEAERAAALIGAESSVWDYDDGRLEPTLPLRDDLVREIRTYRPDVVLTHRPNDYHPDHRAVGTAVQDAAYMLTVPAMVPEVPALKLDPVIAFLPDMFQRPNPFTPDCVIDIAQVMDSSVGMLACHVSQVFEWLPYHDGLLEQVPRDDQGRLAWLAKWYQAVIRPRAEGYRSRLVELVGQPSAMALEFVEAFEICEYGRRPDAKMLKELFAF